MADETPAAAPVPSPPAPAPTPAPTAYTVTVTPATLTIAGANVAALEVTAKNPDGSVAYSGHLDAPH